MKSEVISNPPKQIEIAGRVFALHYDDEDSSYMLYVNDKFSLVGFGHTIAQVCSSFHEEIPEQFELYSSYPVTELSPGATEYLNWLRLAKDLDVSRYRL